jgi:hypothetical protein
VLAAGLREVGLDEGEAWATVDLVRVLLSLPRPSGLHGPARTLEARLLDHWLARDVVRTAIGVNTWQGVEYLDRDAFGRMLGWAVRLDAVEAGDATATGDRPVARVVAAAGPRPSRQPDLVARMSAAAEAAGYRIDALRTALKPAAGRGSQPRARPRRPTSRS